VSEMYNPPNDKIEKVLEKYTPRQIAIAYLRASRRAKGAETAFDLLDSLQGVSDAMSSGDCSGAIKGLNKANRRMARHNDEATS